MYNAGYLDLIPGLGRYPGEGYSLQYSGLENSMDKGAWQATVHGVLYSLQYSGLENSTDKGAWQATVHGVTKSQTRLSNVNFHFWRISLESRPNQGTKTRQGTGQKLKEYKMSNGRRTL